MLSVRAAWSMVSEKKQVMDAQTLQSRVLPQLMSLLHRQQKQNQVLQGANSD